MRAWKSRNIKGSALVFAGRNGGVARRFGEPQETSGEDRGEFNEGAGDRHHGLDATVFPKVNPANPRISGIKFAEKCSDMGVVLRAGGRIDVYCIPFG